MYKLTKKDIADLQKALDYVECNWSSRPSNSISSMKDEFISYLNWDLNDNELYEVVNNWYAESVTYTDTVCQVTKDDDVESYVNIDYKNLSF